MTVFSRHARALALILALGGLLLAPGCKRAHKTTASAKQAQKAGTNAKGAAAGAGHRAVTLPYPGPRLAAPADVLVVFGVPSIKMLASSVSKLANKVVPGRVPPSLTAMMLSGLKMTIGFKDMAWLKQDAPIRGFFVTPKAHGQEGTVTLLPTIGKAKFLAALAPGVKTGAKAGGHAAEFTANGRTWYVDFVKDIAVLADHPDVYGANKDFITKILTNWTPKNLLSVQVDVAAVNRTYGAKIAQTMRSAAQAMTTSGLPGGQQMIQKEVSLLTAAIKATNRLNITAVSGDKDVKLVFGLEPKPGTALAKITKQVAGGSCGMPQAVPKSSWFSVAADVDTRTVKALRDMRGGTLSAYAGILKFSPAERKRAMAIVGKLADMALGESAEAIYTDGVFPFAITGFAEVTDAKAARAQYIQLINLFFPKLWAMAQAKMAQNGSKPPAIEVKNVADLAKLVNAFAGPHGVHLAISHTTTDAVMVDTLTFNFDWPKTGFQRSNAAIYKMLTGIVGKKIEAAAAFKGKNVGFGFGPHGVSAAVSMAKGQWSGGEPTLTAVCKGSAIAISARVGAALRAFIFLPPIAKAKAMIDTLPTDRAVTLTGKSDGTEFAATLTVPVDLLSGLAGLHF